MSGVPGCLDLVSVLCFVITQNLEEAAHQAGNALLLVLVVALSVHVGGQDSACIVQHEILVHRAAFSG
jgi:hypothetical protein